MIQTDKSKVLNKIKERILKIERPYKVFLFGSYAYGEPGAESDIDLLVVLNEETPIKNFEERSKNYLKISRALRDIEREIPIDLIVYTKPEFERLIQLGSMFSKKVIEEGQEIL